MLKKYFGIGLLEHDPEICTTQYGEVMCNFRLSVSKKHKDKEISKKAQDIEWVDITASGKLAEIAGESVKKGSLVYFKGKIQPRKHDKDDKDDKDGAWMRSVHILLSEMRILGNLGEDNQIKPIVSWSERFADPEPADFLFDRDLLSQPCSPAPDFDDDIKF